MSGAAWGGSQPVELVGRHADVATLNAVLNGSRGARVAIIRGEAGIGKTALLRVVLSDAARAHRVVIQAAALEMERDRPFGAIVDALGIDRPDRHPAAVRLAGLLRDPAGSGLPPAEVRHAVVEQLVDLIEERSTPRGGIVAIEDVHWADASTLLTLGRLLGRLPYSDVSVVCSTRPVPASEALVVFLEAVQRAGGTVMDLGALAEEDVASLVRNLLRREPSEQVLAKFESAGGNPFFVHELAAALDDDALSADADGDALDVHLPATVRATVLNRFRFLDHRASELMSVASILGGAFSLDDLCLVLARPASELLAVVRDCVQAGALRDADDRLAFRHDLVREALYEEMPGAVRRGLHAQVARALAAAGRPATQVATHFSAGASPGDREAVEWLRQAAEDASLTAPSIAVELLDRAIALTADRATADELRVELAVSFGYLRRYKEVEEIGRQLLSGPLPPDLARRLQFAVLQSLTAQGRVAEHIELAERLITEATDDVMRSRLSAEVSFSLAISGRIADAEERAAVALDAGERFDDVATIDAALSALVVVTWSTGHSTQALAYGRRRQSIRRRLVVTRQLRDAIGAASVHPGVSRMIALYELDRMEECYEARRELVVELTRLGVPDPESEMRGTAGLVFGRWDEAVAEARSGLASHREHGFSRTIGTAISVLAMILMHRDEMDEARVLLDEADADLVARGGGGLDLLMLGWARALLFEATGDCESAFQIYDGVFSVLRIGQFVPPFRVMAPDLARVAVAVGRADVARQAADELDAVAALEPAVASLQGTALRTRAIAEQEPDLMIQAVITYRSSPRPPEHAYAAEEAGRLLAAAGRGDEAIAFVQEAVEIYERLDAARLVARADAALRSLGIKRGRAGARRRPKTGWESLTEAEQRVVTLIAEGLANGRIAERLYVSKRTVETHVSSIMRKLGVSSRAELIAQAARRPYL